MAGALLVLLLAYLLGSVPTALIVSRLVAGVDIRHIGDGNMGARNTTRTLGWGPGTLVAATDFAKGAAAILLARGVGLPLDWQLTAGVSAVLGHDFPVFAQFRGGQGLAAILGTLFAIMPTETAGGLMAFGTSYLISRRFDPSAGIGLGLMVLLAVRSGEPRAVVGYAVVMFLSIPLKKWMDRPRRLAMKSRTKAT